MCPNAPTVSLLLTIGAVRTAAEMSPAPAVPAVSTVQTENVKYHTASLTVRLKRRPKRWCKKALITTPDDLPQPQHKKTYLQP